MIISRAPVRISFLGGGTDYPEYFLEHGGAVLSTAIDKFCYVTASPFLSHLFDYNIRISYREAETIKEVDEIRHNVFRECLRFCELDKDIELHTVADLPAFTGFGSSSTFTVSLLHTLHSFKGDFKKPLELAYEAIHIERNILKDKVGCQDQTIAAVGGFNVIEFHKEDDIIVHRVPIKPQRLAEFESHLFIIYTGITRRAADVVSPQLAKIKHNSKILREMHKMVDKGLSILTGDKPLSFFGELLHKSWTSKRRLDKMISNDEINALYQKGIEAGALGGKLCGAGGGGFILFFAPPDKHESLKQAFPEHQVLQVKVNSPGSEIIFS
jgi:D-glycero-alpha-D-manno-heptose-7-phosphate kinase